MARLTVIEVMRGMGIEPTSELSWSIGSAVRDEYERTYGSAPVKALRPMTSGPGTHCFALYPMEFLPSIRAIIAGHQTEAARQQSLFEPEAVHG